MNEVEKPRRYAGKKQIVTYVDPSVYESFARLARSRKQSKARLLEQILNYALVKSERVEDINAEYSEEILKTKVYTVRLTDGEGSRLEEEAKRHEMKISTFIRLIIRGVVTQNISLSVVEQDEIRKVRTELTRIGTNLNQAVKILKANPYGENIITAELIAALHTVIEFERQKIQDILVSNLKSWANLYGEEK